LSNPPAARPLIGFDRFIPLDWAACALRVRAGTEEPDALEALLLAAGLGAPSRKKNRSVLKGLWMEPSADLAPFADLGIELWKGDPEVPIQALCWGMAIATYPFFGKVAELIGRLTSIQGDCTAAEIHRRMAETYGEREGTRRATNRVIQTQADWSACERVDKARRVVRQPPLPISHDAVTAWLVEALIRYAGKPLSVTSLQSSAVLYPFRLEQSLTFAISRSPALELRFEGSGSHLVAIK
jgi:hypothetical protein